MTTTVSYEAFLPEVMPFVHDVPEIVALQAIRNACIEFCEETHYLQDTLDPIAGIINQGDYDLDANDSNYKVVEIMQAYYGDQLLIPKSQEELNQIYRTSNWQNLTGNPYYYFRPRATVIRLVTKPVITEANKLVIRAAYAPTRASSTIDSEIFERFLEQIAFGARARLYNTPNQPYYDPKTAMEYTKRFNDALAEVRTRVYKGLTRTAVQIEFQRFA
jgi:hypothetical protein